MTKSVLRSLFRLYHYYVVAVLRFDRWIRVDRRPYGRCRELKRSVLERTYHRASRHPAEVPLDGVKRMNESSH